MAFGAVLDAGFFFAVFFFVIFFFAVFFFTLFFAVLFLAGAFLVVLVLGAVVELCACATYGTVDAPTNASRANAEINAFILRYS